MSQIGEKSEGELFRSIQYLCPAKRRLSAGGVGFVHRAVPAR
jgi:hypothetical protein